jgi:hypothetical protein
MTIILRLLLAILALLPAAAPVTEPPLSGYGLMQPVQSTPAPSIGSAISSGIASWYDAKGDVASVPWWNL